MPFTTLFFDLDDTLYSNANGLWNAIRDRMGQYMHERLGLPWEQIPDLRRHYFITYGTTLRGLQKHHQVDVDEYLAYVHDLPLADYLQPDPELRSLVLSLPQPRWIFTNADDQHAKRVLAQLNLSDCFTGIIDVRAIRFACKPEIDAYQRALHIAGNPHPEQCVMLDDSPSNLAPARQMGFTTVLVRPDDALAAAQHGLQKPACDFTISSLLDLRRALPALWENGHGR
jgi:putative hydrolase of the HAD superfamily